MPKQLLQAAESHVRHQLGPLIVLIFLAMLFIQIQQGKLITEEKEGK